MNRPQALCTALFALMAVFAVAAPPSHGQGPERHDRHERGRHRGNEQPPLVIGHRGGANGYLPEHTLEAYALGIEMGVDYIEPDVVATKDGHLIARHEPNLIDTTNVKDLPQFADRRRTVDVDGVPTEGFFASDFTLNEIKQLRAVQSFAERDQGFNGRFQIPTLEEVIWLAKRKSREEGRRVGVYIETKHPTYHQQLGLPLEERLLRVLNDAGWNHRRAPVFIQSFETANLRALRSQTSVRLIQLVDGNGVNPDGSIDFSKPYDKPYDWVVNNRAGLFSDLLTPAGLAEVRQYADGIGPWKPHLISSACQKIEAGACADVTGDGQVDERDRVLLPPTEVIANAHRAGLLVHPYTFRSEPQRLTGTFQGAAVQEYLAFYEAGVDGLFSDFADTAIAARAMFLLRHDRDYARCLVHQSRRCDRNNYD